MVIIARRLAGIRESVIQARLRGERRASWFVRLMGVGLGVKDIRQARSLNCLERSSSPGIRYPQMLLLALYNFADN